MLETGLLIFLLGSMMLLAVYQVALRNFFDAGIVWADAYVRVTVFWVAMVGALAASRNDEHISIDFLSRLLNPSWRRLINRAQAMLTAALCFIGAWYSVEFVRYEYIDGVIAFASVPAWVCESVMPVALFLIGFRYLCKSLGLGGTKAERAEQEG
ncbi:MAG: TRAP transporter small permease [Pseudomonadales bacterium]|nr:TRAP transporter small permease [Pseudomonadales bacterium]